jgi:membrane protein required for colicin V production
MGITDIVILIILGVFGVKGLFKGLISEVFGILGLILGYLLAFQYYTTGAKVLEYFGISKNISEKAGFVAAFLAIYIIILIIGFLLKKFFKKIQLGWLDKTGGFFFGVVKAAVIVSVILSFIISTMPPKTKFRKDITHSVVTKYIMSLTPYVFDIINKIPKEKKKNPFKL